MYSAPSLRMRAFLFCIFYSLALLYGFTIYLDISLSNIFSNFSFLNSIEMEIILCVFFVTLLAQHFFVKSIHVYVNTIPFIFTVVSFYNVSVFLLMEFFVVLVYDVTKKCCYDILVHMA